MKIEIDVGKILLKSLETDLKNLEECKDDTAVTFFYAQSVQVTEIMYDCGLLNVDQWHTLDHMIDEIMTHSSERIRYEKRSKN